MILNKQQAMELRHARRIKGYSTQQLATALGYKSNKSYWNIEQRHNHISDEQLQILIRLLDLDTNLFGYLDEQGISTSHSKFKPIKYSEEGQYLKKCRIIANLTQAQVANIINTSRSAYNRCETGYNVLPYRIDSQPDIIQALADNVGLDYTAYRDITYNKYNDLSYCINSIQTPEDIESRITVDPDTYKYQSQGQYLQALRHKSGASQAQVAQTLHISQPQYCNAEKGKTLLPHRITHKLEYVLLRNDLTDLIGIDWNVYNNISKLQKQLTEQAIQKELEDNERQGGFYDY